MSQQGRKVDITGITCIYIPVENVYESISWFRTHLGCEPTYHNPIKHDMEKAIIRFPNEDGDFPEPTLRQTVPAIILVKKKYSFQANDQHPIACFITPSIEEMYHRLMENGVTIVSKLSERQSFGRNFTFTDIDDNLLEMWQP